MGKSGRESHWKRGQEKRIRAFSDMSLPSGIDPRVQSSGTVFNEREQEIYNDLSVAADEAKVELEKPGYELYGEGVLVGTVLPKKLPKNKTELGKLVRDTYTKADMDNLSSWYMTGDLKAKELHGKPKSLALIRRELGQILQHKGYSSMQNAKLFNRYIGPLTASIVEVYNSGSRNGISREVMDDEVGPLSQRLFKNIQHILINIPPDSRKESIGVYNEAMNGEPKLQSPAELGKVVPANPKNVGPEMHAEEVSGIFFDFPSGRLKLKGKPSKETLLQYIRPRLGKVYKEIGLTEDKVNSALKKVFETDDTGAIIEQVQRILRNVNFEKSRTTSPVYRENLLTTEIPPVSIEQPLTTIKPSSEVESLPTSVGQTGELETAEGRTEVFIKSPDKISLPDKETELDPEVIAGRGLLTKQMDRLRDKTRTIRESTGLTDKEEMNTNVDFNVLRTNIRKIRNRLKQIEKNEGNIEKQTKLQSEIQSLRDEMSGHLLSFRNVSPRTFEHPYEDAKHHEIHSGDVVSYTTEDGVKVNATVRSVLGSDLYAIGWDEGVKYRTMTVDRKDIAFKKNEEVPEEQNQKKWEERVELKKNWEAKKEAFNEAYKTYLESHPYQKHLSQEQQEPWWPEMLKIQKYEYQQASKAYSASLDEGLAARVKISGAVAETREAFKKKADAERNAMLAEKFIKSPARERTELEKASLLNKAQAKANPQEKIVDNKDKSIDARLESIEQELVDRVDHVTRFWGLFGAKGKWLTDGEPIKVFEAADIVGKKFQAGSITPNVETAKLTRDLLLLLEALQIKYASGAISTKELLAKTVEIEQASALLAKEIPNKSEKSASEKTPGRVKQFFAQWREKKIKKEEAILQESGKNSVYEKGLAIVNTRNKKARNVALAALLLLVGVQIGRQMDKGEEVAKPATTIEKVEPRSAAPAPTGPRIVGTEEVQKKPSVDGKAFTQSGIHVDTSKQVEIPDTAEPKIQEEIVDQGVEGDTLAKVIESEPRTYLGVDDEGYGGDEEYEEEEEPGAGQSTEGYPEAPIIPDISFESGQPVFFMPPHTGMNQILDTHAEWYYNYNHDMGNPVAIDENISRADFVTNASHLQEAMVKYPEYYAEVFDAMEISSHDFRDVPVGKRINLEPFFERLYHYKE